MNNAEHIFLVAVYLGMFRHSHTQPVSYRIYSDGQHTQNMFKTYRYSKLFDLLNKKHIWPDTATRHKKHSNPKKDADTCATRMACR